MAKQNLVKENPPTPNNLQQDSAKKPTTTADSPQRRDTSLKMNDNTFTSVSEPDDQNASTEHDILDQGSQATSDIAGQDVAPRKKNLTKEEKKEKAKKKKFARKQRKASAKREVNISRVEGIVEQTGSTSSSSSNSHAIEQDGSNSSVVTQDDKKNKDANREVAENTNTFDDEKDKAGAADGMRIAENENHEGKISGDFSVADDDEYSDAANTEGVKNSEGDTLQKMHGMVEKIVASKLNAVLQGVSMPQLEGMAVQNMSDSVILDTLVSEKASTSTESANYSRHNERPVPSGPSTPRSCPNSGPVSDLEDAAKPSIPVEEPSTEVYDALFGPCSHCAEIDAKISQQVAKLKNKREGLMNQLSVLHGSAAPSDSSHGYNNTIKKKKKKKAKKSHETLDSPVSDDSIAAKTVEIQESIDDIDERIEDYKVKQRAGELRCKARNLEGYVHQRSVYCLPMDEERAASSHAAKYKEHVAVMGILRAEVSKFRAAADVLEKVGQGEMDTCRSGKCVPKWYAEVCMFILVGWLVASCFGL